MGFSLVTVTSSPLTTAFEDRKFQLISKEVIEFDYTSVKIICVVYRDKSLRYGLTTELGPALGTSHEIECL